MSPDRRRKSRLLGLDAKTVRASGGSIPFSRRVVIWIFWSDLIASFWRGEVSGTVRPFDWQKPIGFYAVSSLLVYCGSGPRIE